MIESKWWTVRSAYSLARALIGTSHVTSRQYRLLTCAIARQGWETLTDSEKLGTLRGELFVSSPDMYQSGETYADGKGYGRVASLCVSESFRNSPALAFSLAVQEVNSPETADTIREILGYPWRKEECRLNASPRAEQARIMANRIYQRRDWQACPILADLCEDAGCDNYAILNHLRAQCCKHVRGCWALDAVLVRRS